jgi:hypothetical protein
VSTDSADGGDRPDQHRPGGGHPGWGPPASPVVPQHPQATTALVLGIVALAGAVMCVLPIVLAPVAWVVGGRAVREIDAHPGRWRGRELAEAGRVMGIVGTCLMAVGLAFTALLLGTAFLPWLPFLF